MRGASVTYIPGKARKMNVPYASKWRKETDELRRIALDCELTEELKWGKPCFTFRKKNVAIVIPFKESCALAFFKGALMKDPGRWLIRAATIRYAYSGEVNAIPG